MWEIPAGSVDDGESPDAAAARECEEEIGLRPGNVRRVRGLYPTPGFCDEELIFYVVSELAPPPADSPYRPDSDELIEPHAMTIAEARALVASGDIVDLKTAYGLTLV
jgi:ADP-ribose pyrophosphatase